MGYHDMAKPHNRKDWNCPWVRKDGRGLKQAIRAIDGPTCPIRTSCKPYYSEPKSILGEDPILTPEQLQQVYDGSMAAILGLNTADLVVEIADQETFDMTHEQAEQAIHNAGNKFQMLIERSG